MAVTGLGIASAVGVGIATFWDGLCAGRSGIREIRAFDPAQLNIKIAGEIACFDPKQHFTDARLELLDRFSQLTLVAAAEAVAHAGLELADADRERTGVSLGTALGGAITQDEAHLSIYQRGRAHPFASPRMMHNAAASQLTMEMHVQGPTLTFSTACAAAAHAIGEGAEIIRAGRADVMLVGGSDAPISFAVLKAWESMRVLAPAPDGDPSRACRPFSRDRQGLVLGEGAGILVLEDWERARRRGAPILAELAGYGATADAGHITQPAVDAPARAIELALKQAGVSAEAIGYVNAHGTGTRLNDSTETQILKRALGAHAHKVAISATKSMHGHAMGASAALELIAAVLAIAHGVVPPTANYTAPDPECDLDYVPNQARDLQIGAALSNSFAFGGLNAVLLVRRPS